MGGFKEQQTAEWDQGWASTDKNVCAECVTDYALADAIRGAASEMQCDYCGEIGSDGPHAAPVDVLSEIITEGLQTEFGNPDDEGVSYVTSEGGYLLPVYDTAELLDELYVTESLELHADLAEAIAGPWCQRDPYRSSPLQVLAGGWKAFREHVTHVRRYMFHLSSRYAEQQRDDGEVPPEDMLAVLMRTLKNGQLTRILPAGTRWVRSRPHEAAERYTSASDLGSPPAGVAKANRMSAGGISAFYGADSHEGALEEIAGYAGPDQHATVATWVTARPMLVIDLVNLPDVPSLFDARGRHLRTNRLFLHGFAEDVTRPARPDDKEHLDYVPTQIVAEYIAQMFQDEKGNRAMGVLWRSSKDRSVTNCVLFVGNGGCVEQRAGWDSKAEAWLGLDPSSVQKGPLASTPHWLKGALQA